MTEHILPVLSKLMKSIAELISVSIEIIYMIIFKKSRIKRLERIRLIWKGIKND